MGKNNVNWMQIMATITVTTVVAIISGMILFQWQTPSKELIYKVNPTLPFNSENQNLYIYHLELTNNGTSEIEDINSHVKIGQGEIVNYSLNASGNLKIIEQLDSNSLELIIKNLNPKEKINYSMILSSKSKEFIEPVISLRGKGIVGKKFKDEDISSFSKIIFTALLLFILSTVLYLYYYSRKMLTRSKAILVETDKLQKEHLKIAKAQAKEYEETVEGCKKDYRDTIEGLQNEYRETVAELEKEYEEFRLLEEPGNFLSYLFFLKELPDDAEYYLNLQNKITSYWIQSERLTYMALTSDNKGYKKKVIEILTIIAKKGEVEKWKNSIQERGIIYYNLAKLHIDLDNKAEFESNWKASNDLIPELISKRLEFDEVMKTATNNG